jgi:hypothetical protein
MNRLISAVAATLVTLLGLLPSVASAQSDMAAEHASGGIGFHNSIAPLGGRWWLAGQKVGIDAGFGYATSPAFLYPDEKVSAWALDVGVPFVLKSWNRAHVLLRPGLIYQSEQVVTTTPPAAFGTDDQTTFTVTGELEAEIFLVDNVSISASEGIGFESVNPVGPGDNITSFSTLGSNFTELGFHVYFLGGNK